MFSVGFGVYLVVLGYYIWSLERKNSKLALHLKSLESRVEKLDSSNKKHLAIVEARVNNLHNLV